MLAVEGTDCERSCTQVAHRRYGVGEAVAEVAYNLLDSCKRYHYDAGTSNSIPETRTRNSHTHAHTVHEARWGNAAAVCTTSCGSVIARVRQRLRALPGLVDLLAVSAVIARPRTMPCAALLPLSRCIYSSTYRYLGTALTTQTSPPADIELFHKILLGLLDDDVSAASIHSIYS
jgi:hypothetical protein